MHSIDYKEVRKFIAYIGLVSIGALLAALLQSQPGKKFYFPLDFEQLVVAQAELVSHVDASIKN